MSYRKDKANKGFGKLRDFVITDNKPEATQDCTKQSSPFNNLEITEETPSYLRMFPWLEELKPYLIDMKAGQGITIELENIGDQPMHGWTIENQRLLIDKFNYAVRMYSEKLDLPLKFGSRTVTSSGKRTLKKHDLAVAVRVFAKSHKLPAVDSPKNQHVNDDKLHENFKTSITWSRTTYRYLSNLSNRSGKSIWQTVRDIVEEHMNERN